MKKTAFLFACAAFVIGGMSLAAPQIASASDFGPSYGSPWNGNQRFDSSYPNNDFQSWRYDRGYLGQSNYGYGQSNYGYGQSNYGYDSPWSSRSSSRQGHYDYHAPSVTPHGNGYHATPGFYDYHRGGHGYHH